MGLLILVIPLARGYVFTWASKSISKEKVEQMKWFEWFFGLSDEKSSFVGLSNVRSASLIFLIAAIVDLLDKGWHEAFCSIDAYKSSFLFIFGSIGFYTIYYALKSVLNKLDQYQKRIEELESQLKKNE